MNRGRKNRNRRHRLWLAALRRRGFVPGKKGSAFGNRMYPASQPDSLLRGATIILCGVPAYEHDGDRFVETPELRAARGPS